MRTADGSRTPGSPSRLQAQAEPETEAKPQPEPEPGYAEILATPLFDHAWYAERSGCRPTRKAAVLHYLRTGHRKRLSPHPLFDTRHYLAQVPRDLWGKPPLLSYLRGIGGTAASPHPLFDVAAYLRSYPEAADHPGGTLAHYLEVGARAGARPNGWFLPDAEPGAGDLAAWVRARHAEWAARAAAAPPPDAGARDLETFLREAAADAPEDAPLIDPVLVERWREAGPARHEPDWAPTDRRLDPATISVVVNVHGDWHRAVRCVGRAAEADPPGGRTVEIVVVNSGCAADPSTVLDSLPLRYPDVRVVHRPVDHGRAVARGAGVAAATGAVTVFLDTATEVTAGWLDPLVRALEDPAVLAAQALLLRQDGLVSTAGVAFPECGGSPYPFLDGFPVEDAERVASVAFGALSGAALAVRTADVVALRGFDPTFAAGMDDVDFCLRLARLRAGRFAVCPAAVVVHADPGVTGGRSTDVVARRLLLHRHRGSLPADDVALWSRVGFEVIRREVPHPSAGYGRTDVAAPVLARRPRAAVTQSPPPLRWAIKNPAPPTDLGRNWGDTHYARALAKALRRLGQEVVLDHAWSFDRPSGAHDDVVLVLRGIAPYHPVPGQTSLLWLISHPEMFARAEAQSYDRVFAASVSWSARMSERWGTRICPLLQATDPELFHPDRAEPDTGHRILFVGGSRRTTPRPLVQGAVRARVPVTVYGPNWAGQIPYEHIAAGYLPNDALGAAYRAAGVVLNDHWAEMRAVGFVSNRLFDAVAAGARVISDDVEGLSGLFGRSVQVAHAPEDVGALCDGDLDATFGTDEERRAVAARVHAEHSFDARAGTLLEAALEVRGR